MKKKIFLLACILFYGLNGTAQDNFCKLLANRVADLPLTEKASYSNYKDHMSNLIRMTHRLKSKTLGEAESAAAGLNIPLKSIVVGFSGSYDEGSYQRLLQVIDNYQKTATHNVNHLVQSLNRTYADYSDVLKECVRNGNKGISYYLIPGVSDPEVLFVRVHYKRLDAASPLWARFSYALEDGVSKTDSINDGDTKLLVIRDTSEDDRYFTLEALNVHNPSDAGPILWVREPEDTGLYESPSDGHLFAYNIRFLLAAGSASSTNQPLGVQLFSSSDSSGIAYMPASYGLTRPNKLTHNFTILSRRKLGKIERVKLVMKQPKKGAVNNVQIQALRVKDFSDNSVKDKLVQRWVGNPTAMSIVVKL